MKLTVKKEFIDKNTAEAHSVGAVIEFEDARAEELLADPRKLVEKYIEKKPAGKGKKPRK